MAKEYKGRKIVFKNGEVKWFDNLFAMMDFFYGKPKLEASIKEEYHWYSDGSLELIERGV